LAIAARFLFCCVYKMAKDALTAIYANNKVHPKGKYYDVRLWVDMLLLVWIPHWTNIFEVRHSTDP